jgi:hypothetical protein
LKQEEENPILGNYLNIAPEISDLRHYRIFDNPALSSSWTELLSLKIDSSFEKRGYSTFDTDSELLVRSIYPFAFLIFSLFSIAIGWVYKSRYTTRPPMIAFFFIPVFPFILALFVNLYVFMSTAISGLALLLYGFIIAMIVTCVIQSVILIFSFLIMAGKVTD